MKILKLSLLLFSLLLLTQLSEAQVAKKLKRFEVNIGLNKTKGHLKLTGAVGFWITPQLVTHLSVLSPQRRTLIFEPSILRLEGGRMEKASIKLGSTTGLNFRAYLKPQSGLFVGLGLSQQKYLITAKSVFDNDSRFSSTGSLLLDLIIAGITGGDHVRKEITSANMWGINWQLGYAFPTKYGRFEFLIRQNNPIVENHQYGYITSQNSRDTKNRFVKSDFGLSPVGFEINFVINIFEYPEN